MKKSMRLAAFCLPTLTLVIWGGEPTTSQPRASPTTRGAEANPLEEVVVNESSEPGLVEAARPQFRPVPVTSAGPRVCNPPSRVIQGPFLRRIVPPPTARPCVRGVYRYEPRIGDIRDLPRELTLPGNEGQRESLWTIPPREKGYFVLNRW